MIRLFSCTYTKTVRTGDGLCKIPFVYASVLLHDIISSASGGIQNFFVKKQHASDRSMPQHSLIQFSRIRRIGTCGGSAGTESAGTVVLASVADGRSNR